MAAASRRSGKRVARKALEAAAASEDLARAMDEAKSTMSTDDITHSLMHDSSAIRLTALKRLCPCKLRGLSSSDDFAAVWDAIFGMVKDDCAKVRTQVLHTICDGSPAFLETRVAAALEEFNHDSDKAIRRTAHKVLASYSRTGKWNIL